MVAMTDAGSPYCPNTVAHNHGALVVGTPSGIAGSAISAGEVSVDPSFMVDDAADMLMVRHGVHASAVAHRQAAELLVGLDHHGAAFWKRIATVVDRSIREEELTGRGWSVGGSSG